MRLHASSGPTDLHALAYRPANPYHTWLNMLCVGAAFACVAYFIDLAFDFASLSSRMRGVPRWGVIRTTYPFVMLGVAAIKWMAVWLLTTEDPSPTSPRHLRAWTLRCLVTTGLMVVFLYVLRMLDDWRIRRSQILLTIYWIDLATTILLWLHLRSIALKLDMRGSRWRALIAMIGMASTIAVLFIVPRLFPELRGVISEAVRNLSNAQSAMMVLWSTVSALVMLRFALGFANTVREDVKLTSFETPARST